MSPPAKSDKRSLPLFVRLGFAGSRMLYSAAEHPEVDPARFQEAVQDHLCARLQVLEGELGIKGCHFVCGISAMAIGGDFTFTRACRARGYLQRVFLPQPRDEFLAAGSDGRPDFSAQQQAEALELLASPDVIEEQVVSDSRDRPTRFQDTNLEIVRNSDVLVCLVRADGTARAGGTAELIALAEDRGRPVLEIRVAVGHGLPEFSETWHNRQEFTAPQWPQRLPPATLPAGAEPCAVPSVIDYCSALKGVGSKKARWQRRLFMAAASIILGTHVLATILAVIALEFRYTSVIPWLLGTELVFLVAGFVMHQYLHGSHACEAWAISRLLAELARSVLAIASLRVSLEYLFTLPFPAAARPFLTTLQVLHLHSSRGDGEGWEKKRQVYVFDRLAAKSGQIAYYERSFQKAQGWGGRFQALFFCCSLAAIAAVVLKLMAHGMTARSTLWEPMTDVLTALVIVLPVLAVAALSLAAAMDLQAREHTYKDMHAFLVRHAGYLQKAKLENDFAALVQETESRLLGETANWYSRRSFTGVT